MDERAQENSPRISTAAVVRTHHQSILRFLRRRGAAPEDALDIAQEAYVRFLRYEGATDIGSPRAMLFRIAGNLAADHGRAAALRRRTRSFEADSYDAEIASEQPSAERELAAEQVVTIVRLAIAALSPQCRSVFLLSRLDGLTYSQIASQCKISIKTVEKHVSHALRVCAERTSLGEGQRRSRGTSHSQRVKTRSESSDARAPAMHGAEQGPYHLAYDAEKQ